MPTEGALQILILALFIESYLKFLINDGFQITITSHSSIFFPQMVLTLFTDDPCHQSNKNRKFAQTQVIPTTFQILPGKEQIQAVIPMSEKKRIVYLRVDEIHYILILILF